MKKNIRVKGLGLLEVEVTRFFSNDHQISYGSFTMRYMFYTLQEAIRLFKIDFLAKRAS